MVFIENTSIQWLHKVWKITTISFTLREKCPYSEIFWSALSQSKCGKIRSRKLRISAYSVRMRENTNQKNSEYGIDTFHAVSLI